MSLIVLFFPNTEVFPYILVPLWRFSHVDQIVDEQFLPCLDIDESLDGGYPTIAWVKHVGPGTVGMETVVHLVTQSGGVIGGGLKLKQRCYYHLSKK